MSTPYAGSIVLALSLFVAGLMHLVLTDEHMAESVILGSGFIVAALAQIILGVLALRPRLTPYRAIIALNAVLIALFAVHATTGLPLPDAQTDAADRGVFGPLEMIDGQAILTKIAELLAITLALWLRHERMQPAEVESLRRAA